MTPATVSLGPLRSMSEALCEYRYMYFDLQYVKCQQGILFAAPVCGLAAVIKHIAYRGTLDRYRQKVYSPPAFSPHVHPSIVSAGPLPDSQGSYGMPGVKSSRSLLMTVQLTQCCDAPPPSYPCIASRVTQRQRLPPAQHPQERKPVQALLLPRQRILISNLQIQYSSPVTH